MVLVPMVAVEMVPKKVRSPDYLWGRQSAGFLCRSSQHQALKAFPGRDRWGWVGGSGCPGDVHSSDLDEQPSDLVASRMHICLASSSPTQHVGAHFTGFL